MLIRRILLCQRWAYNLWEFDPAEHQMLQEIFDMTHEDVWKVLFKATEVPPPITEDRGLGAKRQAHPVSFYIFARCAFYQHIRRRKLSLHDDLFRTGYR